MPFGQLVIGPPGSGKSTYCNGLHQFLSAIGRKCSVVNLDPANESTSYPCALDVRDLVTLEETMDDEGDIRLGPNGGVLYALEELEANFEWLEAGLKRLGDDYVLFDCPGQVELFTHHSSLRNIFLRIQKLGYRLVVVHLTDSYILTLPSLYISTLLLSLRSMLQLDLPHLNVLTKIDNLARYHPPPAFDLDFYTEVQDLRYLLPALRDELSGPTPTTEEGEATDAPPSRLHAKFEALNEAIIDLVQDFGLVAYETLAVEDRKSMMHLLQVVDRAGGYAFGGAEGANDMVWQVVMREGPAVGGDVRDVQERWVDAREAFDESEKRGWEEEAKAEGRGERGDEDDMDVDDDLDDLGEVRAAPRTYVKERR